MRHSALPTLASALLLAPLAPAMADGAAAPGGTSCEGAPLAVTCDSGYDPLAAYAVLFLRPRSEADDARIAAVAEQACYSIVSTDTGRELRRVPAMLHPAEGVEAENYSPVAFAAVQRGSTVDAPRVWCAAAPAFAGSKERALLTLPGLGTVARVDQPPTWSMELRVEPDAAHGIRGALLLVPSYRVDFKDRRRVLGAVNWYICSVDGKPVNNLKLTRLQRTEEGKDDYTYSPSAELVKQYPQLAGFQLGTDATLTAMLFDTNRYVPDDDLSVRALIYRPSGVNCRIGLRAVPYFKSIYGHSHDEKWSGDELADWIATTLEPTE